MKAAIVILILSLVACTRKVYLPGQIIVKDSLVKDSVIVVKDSLITIPGKTVVLTDTIKCDSSLFVDLQKRKDGATISVKIRKNILTASCECDSLKILVQTLRRELIRQTAFKSRNEVKVIDKPVKVPFVPKWVYAVITYAVFITVWHFRKPIVKLIQYYRP